MNTLSFRRFFLLVVVSLGAAGIFLGGLYLFVKVPAKTYSVQDRLDQYGSRVREHVEPGFQWAGIPYPPKSMVILAFKKERTLQLYVPKLQGEWTCLKSYPIYAASGQIGPKLREGDSQVPEGFYKVTYLNPNSSFHLSLRLGYPSAEDRAQAIRDKRQNLGSDIMIHGGAASVGCIAVGDPAIEEIFTLAAQMELEKIQVILSPYDFRQGEHPEWIADQPPWVQERYVKIREALTHYPLPAPQPPVVLEAEPAFIPKATPVN